jgi:hypothetical protein
VWEISHKEIFSPTFRADHKLTQDQVQEIRFLLGRLSSATAARKILLSRLDRPVKDVMSESTTEMKLGIPDPSVENKEENLVDVGGMETVETDEVSYIWPSRGIDGLSMDNFFERPIQIDTFTISAAGGTVSRELDIWDLFSKIPAVRSKFRNYSYFRGHMKIKIAVSGTNFHYGRIFASYQPYAARNAVLAAHQSALAADANWAPLYNSYLLQSNESVIIDPKDNQPVVMNIPFYSPKSAHRLFNDSTSALAATSSYDDFADAGTLFIRTLNPIQAVSATPSPISVFVYAWMEKVELGVPTGTIVDITSESDSSVSEERVGPVEYWSSVAADVASSLSLVPYFRPFAMPTAMVAGGFSKIAHIFGWARPISENPNMRMKYHGFANGANTSALDTGYKITLDPKQELAMRVENIDSEEDQLAINYIASRFSYFTTFSWSPSDTPMSNPIWFCAVHPLTNTYLINPLDTTQAWVQPTSISFAAQPFSYWHGKITYRFDFVVSGFHRGKMAVFYEPNVSQWSLMTATIELNKQYMHIIDLQEVQSVEYIVDWASRRSWLRCCFVDSSAVFIKDIYGDNTVFDGQDFAEYANGFLAFVPFTNLQSPDDSSVNINCFIKCDDLKLNGVRRDAIPNDRDILSEACCVMQPVPSEVLNPTSFDDTQICSEHFGERPVSYRSLLKRFMLTAFDYGTDPAPYNIEGPIIPLPIPLLGTSVLGWQVSLYGYLRYAYMGARGSMRHRFIQSVGRGSNNYTMTYVSLKDPVETSSTFGPVVTNDTIRYVSPTGTIINEAVHCGCIEFEAPFYSNNLFVFSFANDLMGTNTGNQMDPVWYKDFTIHIPGDGTSVTQLNYLASSTGEDFNFLRFSGGVPYTCAKL